MNVWFSSDWHLNHEDMIHFVNYDGYKVRPEFASLKEMNEYLIDRHNEFVRPNDKFYHLGDVGFNRQELEKQLPRMQGKKRLILGNHDVYKMSWYEQFFHKILVSWRPKRALIFTHFPIRIGVDGQKLKANVHGHIHRQKIDDKRYLNISVEMTGYRPLHYDEIIQHYKNQDIQVEKDNDSTHD